MKKFIGIMVLGFASASVGAAQEPTKIEITKTQTEKKSVMKATSEDKLATFDADGKIKRGAAIGNAKKVSLAKAMKNPSKYSDTPILVEGFIKRSCKMEGCWLELAPTMEGSAVRVKMKDHAFFVPLSAAGLKAKVEGVISIKTLSKEHVDHLIKDDGAKFDKINADGTVTELSFEATGIELRRN